MAKKNTELFDRLRQIGLRKQAAKALSEVSQSAGNKAQRAARVAANELRALADEIEQRLPTPAPPSDASAAKRTPAARARKPTPAGTRSSAAGTRRRHHRQAQTPQIDHPAQRTVPPPGADGSHGERGRQPHARAGPANVSPTGAPTQRGKPQPTHGPQHQR